VASSGKTTKSAFPLAASIKSRILEVFPSRSPTMRLGCAKANFILICLNMKDYKLTVNLLEALKSAGFYICNMKDIEIPKLTPFF